MGTPWDGTVPGWRDDVQLGVDQALLDPGSEEGAIILGRSGSSLPDDPGFRAGPGNFLHLLHRVQPVEPRPGCPGRGSQPDLPPLEGRDAEGLRRPCAEAG